MSKFVTLEDYNGIIEKYKHVIEEGTNWTPIDNFNCVLLKGHYPISKKKYIEVLNENCTELEINGGNPSSSLKRYIEIEFTGNSFNQSQYAYNPLGGTDIEIDYGDGTVVSSNGDYGHSYSTYGTHIIKIYGINELKTNCFLGTPIHKITLPNTVTKLKAAAFQGCSQLESINIPTSITEIGSGCFYNCINLEEIYIPKTLTSIGDDCFSGCSSLNKVHLNWTSISEIIPHDLLFVAVTGDDILYGEEDLLGAINPSEPMNDNLIFEIPYGTSSDYIAKGYPSDKLVEKEGIIAPIQTDSKGTYIEWYLDSGETNYKVRDNLGDIQTFNIIQAYGQKNVKLDSATSLYRGTTNDISDLFDGELEYTVEYMGRPITDVYLDKNTSNEILLDIHVLPDSDGGFVSIDKKIEVPVKTKILTSPEDFENYDYGIIGQINNKSFVIQENGEYMGELNVTSLTDNSITNNADLTLGGGYIANNKIINNGRLIINGATLSDDTIINNGELIFNNANIGTAYSIINKGTVVFNNCDIQYNSYDGTPFIHSINTDFHFNESEIVVNDLNYYHQFVYDKGFGICLFRANDYPVEEILANNSITYDVYTLSNESKYIIEGNGVCYCEIDDNHLKFVNLTVTEVD